MTETAKTPRTKSKLATAVLFCIACIALNCLGKQIILILGLPLYLDCMGTITAGAIGGYVPGLVVGYVTNLIASIADPESAYWCITSMLIAVISAWAAKKGWFSKVGTVLLLIITFALLGSGLGSVITWILYGITGQWEPSETALWFEGVTGIGGFASQVGADFLWDMLDKTISIVIAIALIRLISAKLADKLDFSNWKQTPLEDEEFDAAMGADTRKASLRTKIVGILAIVMIIVAGVTTTVSSVMFLSSHIDTQTKTAQGVASLMSDKIDANRIDDFLAQGAADPGYAETEADLAEIRGKFEDVEYTYVYKIEDDGCHVVFDIATEDTEASTPGEVIEFDPTFEPYLPDLLAGNEIEPIVSNDSYGWLLTVYYPLRDDAGVTQAYLGIDVSMHDLVADATSFFARIVLLFLAFFVLVCAVTIWIAEYGIILPVNSIAIASSDFAFDVRSSRKGSVSKLAKLDVHTGDEIENLYQAITKTSEDTVAFIADSREKAETINRMQENLIMVMADLVESRDKFTGDHVRKTAAYTKVTMEQMREDGMYPDELTDQFIEDVYKSAPLHDIGKIVVSDTILNKPGKLTEEEFEVMKDHTTAGEQILADAIGAMADPGYLDEARRLAKYHHEKWNGKGYPCGLAGEEIPLSARIMAVADVFDALISKRSYKDGMPMEKAFSIIREEAGEHFDPLVAKAFLEAEEEVRKIAEEHGDAAGTAGDIRDE